MVAIAIENLSKAYGRIRALADDLGFERVHRDNAIAGAFQLFGDPVAGAITLA